MCQRAPLAGSARALVVITRLDTAGTPEREQPALAPSLDKATQGDVDRFALGLHVGELHGLPDQIVVENDIGTHTPPDVYEKCSILGGYLGDAEVSFRHENRP